MNPVSDVIIGRDETGAQQAMVGTYSIPPGAETSSFRFSQNLSPTALNRSSLENPALLGLEEIFGFDVMELQGQDEQEVTGRTRNFRRGLPQP